MSTQAETDSIAVTPNATETVASKAKIATTLQLLEQGRMIRILQLKLRDALDTTGEAPVSTMRAKFKSVYSFRCPAHVASENISKFITYRDRKF